MPTRALVLLFALLAAGLARAQDVAVYWVPDASTAPVKHLAPADPALAAAQPAADPAKAADGWMSTNLTGAFPGWAPSNSAHKNLFIKAGTPIHQLPRNDSPVLGLAQDDPETGVDEVQGDWCRVTFPGPVLVYFKQVKAPAPPPAPAPTPPAPAPTPPAQAAPPPVAVAVPANAANLPHYYIGILKLRTNPTIGGPAEAKYILVNNGQLLALVNLDKVILPGPASDFVGKRVSIYGIAEPAPDSFVALILAQLVQLN
jgi:hypothetical protein